MAGAVQPAPRPRSGGSPDQLGPVPHGKYSEARKLDAFSCHQSIGHLAEYLLDHCRRLIARKSGRCVRRLDQVCPDNVFTGYQPLSWFSEKLQYRASHYGGCFCSSFFIRVWRCSSISDARRSSYRLRSECVMVRVTCSWEAFRLLRTCFGQS